MTPLHYAAKEGHTEVVQKLLEAKVPVDAQTNGGRGPLRFFRDRLVNCVRSQGVRFVMTSFSTFTEISLCRMGCS